MLASGRTEPPHVVARLNRFGSTETAKRYFEMVAKTLPPPQAQPTPQQLLAVRQQQQVRGPTPARRLLESFPLCSCNQ